MYLGIDFWSAHVVGIQLKYVPVLFSSLLTVRSVISFISQISVKLILNLSVALDIY